MIFDVHESKPLAVTILWSLVLLITSLSTGAGAEIDPSPATIGIENVRHIERQDVATPGQFSTLSPDGMYLATGSYDGTVALMSIGQNFRSRIIADAGDMVWGVRFSPDSRWLARWGSRGLTIHDLDFSPDGQLLVSTGQRSTVKIWSIDDSTLSGTCTGHNGNVFAADFSPDGALLVTSGDDRCSVIWRVPSWELLKRLPHQGEGFSADFSPDGKLIVTPESDSHLAIWSIDKKTDGRPD